jgi:S-adenosylmethionine hydrolase
LSWSSPTIEGREIIGQVIHVDRFGNLITNILPGERSMRSVEINRRMVPRLVRTYGEGSGLVALVGSSGYLEIAVVNGNAAIETGLRRGAPVIVSFE